MLKTRLIPVLLLKNGQLVRSEEFGNHRIIGDPVHEVERFNQWNVDELIYLDITQGEYNVQRRADHKTQGMEDPLEILSAVSKTCFMPLTFGGRITTFEDAVARFSRGADKVTLNNALFHNLDLLPEIVKTYGTQGVVASIDCYRHGDGRYEVFTTRKSVPTGKNPADWARQIEDLGAGEILLQSINNDGKGIGYDLELINLVSSAVDIAVIACGGVGMYEHYAKGIDAGASAVAAANIWHFKELSDKNGKRALQRMGKNVRLW
jgi:cyclase